MSKNARPFESVLMKANIRSKEQPETKNNNDRHTYPRASTYCFEASSSSTTMPEPTLRLLSRAQTHSHQTSEIMKTKRTRVIPRNDRANGPQPARARLAVAALRLAAHQPSIVTQRSRVSKRLLARRAASASIRATQTYKKTHRAV